MKPFRILSAAVFGTVVAVIGAPLEAVAQKAPKTPIVDGKLWMGSSTLERRAFLIGAGNMIALEMAYAKKAGTAEPPAGTQARKAVETMTLEDIEERITRWYEANPGRLDTPVMGVIWNDMVKKSGN